jgi:NAD(P)H-hydrate epimerase
LAAQVRELDRRAIEEFGVPSSLLMENAGRALAFEVERQLAARGGKRAAILVGPGNNGGDGLVVARRLTAVGASVEVVGVGDLDAAAQRSADFALQRSLWSGIGGTIIRPETWGGVLSRADLAVDALFGTGLSRAVEGAPAAALEALAGWGGPVVACDLPSGLDSDDGSLHGPVAPAVATVTFAVWKQGLRRGHGPRVAGQVQVAEIGIPPALIAELERLDAPRG